MTTMSESRPAHHWLAHRLKSSLDVNGSGSGHESHSSSNGHKVSFSGSSKASAKRDPSLQRSPTSPHTSRPSSPAIAGKASTTAHIPAKSNLRKAPQQANASQPNIHQYSDTRNLQRINRQSEALWQHRVLPPDTTQPKPFLIYHDSFLNLLGPKPTLQLLIDDKRAPYFHEAGVFHPPTNTLFITSNQLEDTNPDAVTTRNKTIVITKLEFFSPTDFMRDKVRCPERNYMACGGTNYRDGILLCAQGSLREPSGLIFMEAKRPHKTTTLLNNYHSRPFNSPNSVAVHSDGSIWFTDPIYGHEQGFRPKPHLPQLVYRFDPTTGDIRVVADGLGRPKGLAFSPDEKTLYLTDTDLYHGTMETHLPSSHDHRRAATVYAYTLLWEQGGPFLINKRVFAYADTGAPSGIHTDVFGNVYAACGDGLNVWNAGGMLIGKVQIDGGCVNFCFGRAGELWVLGEHKLWRCQLGADTKGALLGI